jgi:transcriptional regulator with XRE-family HTH domain
MPRTTYSAVASRAAGRAIRNARRELGLTQIELAKRIGVSAPYVSGLEAGQENLTVGQLWAVADALRVELHIELRVPQEQPTPSIPAPPEQMSKPQQL